MRAQHLKLNKNLLKNCSTSVGIVSIYDKYNSVIIGLAETAVLDIMAANLQQQRSINEQLRREVGIPRIQVSEACLLMMKYVSEHENDDCLLSGFSNQKVNPFREKNSCNIL